jgi:hypothetical protein
MEIKYTVDDVNAAYRGAVKETDARWLAAVAEVRKSVKAEHCSSLVSVYRVREWLDELVRRATWKEDA